MPGRDGLERLEAVARGHDVVAAGREDGFEQPDVLGYVVDDENPAGPQPPLQYSATARSSSTTSTGFERYPSNPASRNRSRSSCIA